MLRKVKNVLTSFLTWSGRLLHSLQSPLAIAPFPECLSLFSGFPSSFVPWDSEKGSSITLRSWVHLILAAAIPDAAQGQRWELRDWVTEQSGGNTVNGLLPEQRACLLAVGLPCSASLGKENILGQDGQSSEFCSLFFFWVIVLGWWLHCGCIYHLCYSLA